MTKPIFPTKTVDYSESVEDRLTENALNLVLPQRYYTKDEDGNVNEDADGMFTRVANNVAEAEKEYESGDYEKWSQEFAEAMKTLQFMPNSPTLMNAGTDIQQLSACFVNSPDDDMTDILETSKEAGLIFKSGGGIGYAFSHLRPKGDYVQSTGGKSSGAVSFMKVFDSVCGTVKQGGKRRGAQMAIMKADHPDVGRFVCAKRREGDFSNFNISVGITEEFEEKLREYDRNAPASESPQYTLINPRTNEPFEVVQETANFYNTEFEDAEEGLAEENFWRDYADDIKGIDKWRGETELQVGETMTLPVGFIWDIMVDGAWKNGEPGVFNYWKTNKDHSIDIEEHPNHEIAATNPCAEQPLEEYEACNLGHINLSLMLEEDAPTFEEFVDGYGSDMYPELDEHGVEGYNLLIEEEQFEVVGEYICRAIDIERLNHIIETGTRFLDNVVDQSDFPLEEIEETVDSMRKIGLGIMGYAQMLIQMGVQYGDEVSLEIAEQIMSHINQRSKKVSHQLAKERGNFHYYEDSKYADLNEYEEWAKKHDIPEVDKHDEYPIRNHNTTTIAPTGTTSMIGNTSGGCEPLYDVAYIKNAANDITGDEFMVEFDDYFLETLKANDIDVEAVKEEAKELQTNEDKSWEGAKSLSTVPDDIAEKFVVTKDLSPEQHARVQGAFQRGVDSGISKTINMPTEASRADVEEAYELALSLDIKGITVYRAGSREKQVNTTRANNRVFSEEEKEDMLDDIERVAEEDEEFVEELKNRVGVQTEEKQKVRVGGDD